MPAVFVYVVVLEESIGNPDIAIRGSKDAASALGVVLLIEATLNLEECSVNYIEGPAPVAEILLYRAVDELGITV